jgi:hypothetical protein
LSKSLPMVHLIVAAILLIVGAFVCCLYSMLVLVFSEGSGYKVFSQCAWRVLRSRYV